MMKTTEKTREQIIEEKVRTMCDYLSEFYKYTNDHDHYKAGNILRKMCDELEIEIIDYYPEYYKIKFKIITSYNDYSYIVLYRCFVYFDGIFFTNETEDHVLYKMIVNRC